MVITYKSSRSLCVYLFKQNDKKRYTHIPNGGYKMDKPKTMKNSNIRISKVNNTKNGTVIYEKEDILKILEDWSNEKEIEYFFIEHAEDLENIHYHVVIKYSSPTRFDTIKNKFQYGNIENSKSVKNSIQYLVHLNSPEKYQHDWSEVVTNSNELNKYMLKSKISEELDINFYVEEIAKGNIKEYQYTEKIPVEIYTKYHTRIEKAFKYYYDNFSLESNRNITVEFYHGSSGSGKTTYAKMKCIENNYSYCISSSSNDVMQDYKGEDVLILDDLRDENFKFDDILKLLDNNTNSSIKSRYKNKMFIGKKIIITSTSPLHEWYKNERRYEEIHQLRRRIKLLLNFEMDKINLLFYNKFTKKYELYDTITNDYYLNNELDEFDDITNYIKESGYISKL